MIFLLHLFFQMSLFCSLNFPVCLGELPIHNQAIHEAQKPSEDITDSLEVAGVGAFNSVERVSHDAEFIT